LDNSYIKDIKIKKNFERGRAVKLADFRWTGTEVDAEGSKESESVSFKKNYSLNYIFS